MPSELLEAVRQLTDDELVFRLKSLAARERASTAELVVHIAELDTRDLHLRAGYGSLYVYCRDALLLSEHEAYNRIGAARAAWRFPVVLEMLVEGALNTTTLRLLARHLTEENHRAVLESARGKKKAEVEQIVAGLWPQPDAPPLVRRLPSRPAPSLSIGDARPVAATPVSAEKFAVVPPAVPPAPRPAAVATSLAPDRYKVQFTIGTQTLEKLRLAKDMLRHAIPSGDDAAILDRALTVLLAELARKKFAACARPRAGFGRRSRIPLCSLRGSQSRLASRRRAVRVRGGGRPALRTARLPRVPPREALGSGRRADGREHLAPMPAAQRLRVEGLLRPGPPARRRGTRAGGGQSLRNGFRDESDDAPRRRGRYRSTRSGTSSRSRAAAHLFFVFAAASCFRTCTSWPTW
jgi:hypothetical protein